MSASFDGSTQYLHGSAPVTNYPFTVSCWVKDSSYTANRTAVNLEYGTNDTVKLSTGAGGTSPAAARDASTIAATSTTHDTTTTGAINTWHHYCIVFASSISRKVYLNGGGMHESTTDKSFAGALAKLVVGAQWGGGTPISYLSASVAEVAIYDAALDATAVGNLAAGVNPQDIADLVSYHPLEADADPVVGAITLTNVGTVTFSSGDHPTIDPPTGGGPSISMLASEENY